MPSLRESYCLSQVGHPPEDEEGNAPAADGESAADTSARQL